MIYTGLILGFLGSLHCAAMCGPLMLGLGTKNYNYFKLFIHHIGRWIGYILIAALFRVIVAPLKIFELQQFIGLTSGILLILVGLRSYIKPVDTGLKQISNLLAKAMGKTNNSLASNISLGVLNGLIPCGLSFSSAIISVNFGTFNQAALFMLLFGLGTTPILFAISILPKLGKSAWMLKLNTFTPKIILVAGFILVIRSSGLGIPYISPSFDYEQQKAECCEPIK